MTADSLTLARALHILSIVHWIGGVAIVTTVILPAVARLSEASRRVAVFEEIEGRFSQQAKVSVTLAGITGFWMTEHLDAWHRFAEISFWWMHAMVLLWTIFTVVLFIAEPFYLHAWFRRRAAEDPEATFRLIQRTHCLLLVLSAATVAGAALGARGAFL